MIISVASGKGGTGKTMISVNLSDSLSEIVKTIFLDCDVEEPNSHLFLQPEITNTEDVNVIVPIIDKTKCIHCGKCQNVCEFNAILSFSKETLVLENLCHGCRGCIIVCPQSAISESKRKIGIIQKGKTKKNIEFINGILEVKEAMATPLIKKVIQKLDNLDDDDKTNYSVIIDCPPGTSCPMVNSIKISDYCILVTEPTPFGLSDLKLAVEVVNKLEIPFGVIINKADKNNSIIENYCQEKNIAILMKIPFDRDIAIKCSYGNLITEYKEEYKKNFKNLFNSILRQLKKN